MKLKIISLFIFAMTSFFFGKADNSLPDFAFPETVDKNAKQDLKKALKDNDAHAALNALIRSIVAENLIAPNQLPKSILLVEETIAQLKDNDLTGLFDLLLADLYNYEYLSNQYKYEERELPLEPFPKDITEWSGDQFTLKINSLYKKACNYGQQLSKLKVADYEDIIKSSKLSYIYFPTLFDFVCIHALTNAEKQNSDTYISICDKAIAFSAPGSAPYILWTLKKTIHSNNDFNTGKQLFDEYSNNQYAVCILTQCNSLPDYNGDDNLAKSKWMVENIDAFLKRFPNCPLANQLKSIRQELTQGKVTLSVPSMCTPNTPFNVVIQCVNATNIQIKVYQLPSTKQNRYGIDLKEVLKLQPQQTFNREYAAVAPFVIKDTLQITLPGNANYAIVPFIDGQASERYTYVNRTKCSQVYAFAGNGLSMPMLFATDSYTGQPLPDASATVMGKNDKVVCSSTTNADGIAYFSNFSENRYTIEDILISKDGTTYNFPELYLDANDNNNLHTVTNAQILTDRAIYHPGETVHALAVAYTESENSDYTSEKELLKSVQLKATLTDANYKEVSTVNVTTDQFGRASFDFQLPDDGRLTGYYRISLYDSKRKMETAFVMVSDYRMPDFKISITSIDRDQPKQGCVTIKGNAQYYSGVPVQNAEIEAELSVSLIWRWFGNDRTLESYSATTDENGDFTIIISKEELEDNEMPCSVFVVNFTATSPSGSSAYESCIFNTGKQYGIRIENDSQVVNGAIPFTPQVETTTYDNKAAQFPLLWTLSKGKEILLEGKIGDKIDFSNVMPGEYLFTVKPEDAALADPQSCSLIIYNKNSDVIPGEGEIFLLNRNYDFVQGQPLSICIGTKGEATYVYAILSDYNVNRSISMTQCGQGYHDIEIKIPDNFEGGMISLLCVKDSRLYQETINLRKKEKPNLTIVAESFRDKLIPEQTEEWKFTISFADGHPVETAFAIDMYNKALDVLEPHTFSIRFPQDNVSSFLSFNYSNSSSKDNTCTAKIERIIYEILENPDFNFYGYSLGYANSRFYADGVCNMYKALPNSAMASDMVEECVVQSPMLGAAAESSYEENEEEEMEQNRVMPSEEFRDAEVPLAVWAPMLTTNADGSLTYSFTVPNANATWVLNAIAWTQDMQCGNLMRELVASKPVMVAPNAPRFLRTGDESQISVSVINNTDSAANISVTAEIFDPITKEILSTYTYALDIASNGNTPVTVPIAAQSAASIGFRVKATNGQFSDGEQSIIPILPSMAQLIETEPFYLNPGEKEYSTTLPSAEDSKITLTYCENPIWSIVSALPGLRYYEGNYAEFAAASIFSSAAAQGILKDHPAIADALKAWAENPSDSMLVSMLEKNEELKIAVLNATPWVQAAHSDSERMANLAMIFSEKEVSKAIADAINKLEMLQQSDGGWAWSTWCKESSRWITLEVLYRFAYLKEYGWMPSDKRLDGMIAKALKFVDNSYKAKDTDIDYAIIRPQFKDMQISMRGQQVINNTIQEIIKNGKKYVDPAYKSTAAMALYYNGYKTMAAELMKSVKEFGVWSESQGLEYPRAYGLVDYARILEAFALVTPNSKEVDGLRQHLIVNKQANNWGTFSITSRVIAAILSSGANWVPEGNGAIVTIGSNVISASSLIDKATTSIKEDISQYAGQRLTITTPSLGPSYGAVFSQFSQAMESVESSSCDDLSIEKNVVKRQDASWVAMGDTLKVGDVIKVTLTIHCKRELQYVMIVDERPASFEPIDQIPGYIYSEGIAFYRENRDSYTSMCVRYLPKGTYILTYEMHVGIAGNYSSGVASIQSQYAPEISAHSSGNRIHVSK